jgi:mannose-6-phosphate isomerase
VAKVWGRRDLPAPFGAVPPEAEPVGEVWFEDPQGRDAELLVKYLFTSEKLSVQVHPDEAAAHARGQRRGKDEAWWVVSADRDATIGLGLVERLDKVELRAAAADGRIESLLDWRPVRAGDNFYSPAGTIHAIGPGLALIEIQQNADLTYRLFDYGRDRELHLDEALAVADAAPYREPGRRRELAPGRDILAEGGAFVLERWTGLGAGALEHGPLWIVPLDGRGALDGLSFATGEAWLIEGGAAISLPEGCSVLAAYPGGGVRPEILILS